jgi:uncharacterized protein (DUF1778 family)
MATAPIKSERLEARVTPEQKALFQRAADLAGRSLTDFIVSSLQAASEETIQRHQLIRLTAEESAAFAAALLDPPAPNARLRAALARHRDVIGE